MDEDVGRSSGEEIAHHLGSLWFLAVVSTSFMNRRHSSSSHGRAMHCTATGSPTDPFTACPESVCKSEPASWSQVPCPAFRTTRRYALIQISHLQSILEQRLPGSQSSRLPQLSVKPGETVLTLSTIFQGKTSSLCKERPTTRKYKTEYPPDVLSKGKKNVQIPDPEPGYTSQ